MNVARSLLSDVHVSAFAIMRYYVITLCYATWAVTDRALAAAKWVVS